AIGTPLFMPREQMRGEGTIGPPADLYALAHIAFALLTGDAYWAQEKRQVDNAFALMMAIAEGISEPASTRAGRVGVALPPAFDGWFARATALRPADRYPSASALVDDLRRALGGPALEATAPLLSAPPAPPPERLTTQGAKSEPAQRRG